MLETLQDYLAQNLVLNLAIAALLIGLSFLVTNQLIARSIIAFVGKTERKFDDIIVRHIRPRRLALIAPLLLISAFADLIPDVQHIIQKAVLFVALWLGVVTLNGLMDGFSEIYRAREALTGESIKGYLDLIKLLAIIVGAILSISLITGQDVTGVLTGLGAITAVLMLIFRDTILSLVASFQISTNDLVHVGDWLEVPSFDADGDVIDISLHQIRIQNWDKTISIVPTYKILDVAYKNWRGMSKSGGRRIKRAIHIDLDSIHFCDDATIERFKQFHLVQEYLEETLAQVKQSNKELGLDANVLANSRGLTNVGTFRAYINAYLRNHPQIRQDMTMLVRQLPPSKSGLPIEIYVFTNTTVWADYESIQADIFDHLLAVVPQFDLHLFQEPTGKNFERIIQS